MQNMQKISFLSAVIININVMLGAGLFVNTAILAHRAGSFGFLGYAITGVLLFPLIICIGELIRLIPQGGFYGYAATAFGPLIGFISSWSYFTAKLASAGLTLHTAMLLFQQLIPALSTISTFILDCGVLACFIMLNMYNVKTGTSIQSFFMGAKLVPLVSGIVGGLWLFKGTPFNPADCSFSGIASTLPLVLYATIGFEAAVSLSSTLDNPEKNGPRVIITSYSIVIILACLYQALFHGAVGSKLAAATDFSKSFALLFNTLFSSPETAHIATSLAYIAIAASALGGCYGILFSNQWNLFRLAEHKQITGYQFLSSLNTHQIPWMCVLIEGCICVIYLIMTQGKLLLLQQISGLGTVITYTLSVLSLMQLKRTNKSVQPTWALLILGLGNCFILTGACINSLISTQSSTLTAFAVIMTLGITLFSLAHFKRN